MAGLIFDDQVYKLIQGTITFICWGTIGAALGGVAGFVIGLLVSSSDSACYFICDETFNSLIGLFIGAAVGSILGNIIRVLLIDESYLRGRKLVVLFAILFISIPAGAILGLGLSYIGIIIFFEFV